MTRFTAAIRALEKEAEYLERLADAYRQGARMLAEHEQTFSGEVESQSHDHSPSKAAAPQGGEETAAPHKRRKRFVDLPLSTQCALRCADKLFWQMWRDKTGRVVETKEQMVKIICDECGIARQTELNSNETAAHWWRGHEAYFQQWLTEQAEREQTSGDEGERSAYALPPAVTQDEALYGLPSKWTGAKPVEMDIPDCLRREANNA